MNKLLKKLIRDILLSKGQFIAVILVIAIGTAFFTGFQITHKSLKNAVDSFYHKQNLSDLWVYYQSISEDGINKIKEIDSVDNAEGRLRLEGSLSSGKTGEFTIHTLSANRQINIPHLLEGSFPKDGKECIIDTGYAKANHLQVGDSIPILIQNKQFTFKISGIYNSPEYIYLVKSIEDLLPDHEKFGVLFLHHDFIKEFSGTVLYNEVIVDTKDGTDLKASLKTIEEKTASYGYGYGIDRKHLISYVMLNSDVEQLKKMALFFPNIFFLVAAIIIFISMSRQVELQRNQVAVMKALGIRNSVILLHFLGFSMITGIVGCIIGSLTGIFLLPQGLYTSYAMAYTLPQISPSGFVSNVLAASGLALSFGLLATIFSCFRMLKEIPAQAMRPKPPKKIKPIIFERSEKLWNKISYNKKLILRNIFVNKKRGVLSSIGIIGCVGLILASLAMNDAMKDIINRQFNEINQYDISVVLKAPVQTSEDMQFGDSNIKNIYKQSTISASFKPAGKEDVSTNLNVLPKKNEAVVLLDEDDKPIPLPDDGIIISKDYADRYKIKIGDTMNIKLMPPMQKSERVNAVVKGICVTYLSQGLFASFEYLDSLKIKMMVDTFYLTVNDQAKSSETVQHLKKDVRIKTAASKEEIAKKVRDSMEVMNTFIAIMIAASAVLALAVVFNISSINIFERRRDIATLKVLGYYSNEVNSLVFTENLFITAFGAVLGMGFGALIYWILINTMVPEGMVLPYEIRPLAPLLAVVLGFVFTILANQMLRRRIKKIDMVESLKSVE